MMHDGCKADLHVKLVRQNLHLKTQLLELEIAELTRKRAIKIYLNIHESGIFSDYEAFFSSQGEINWLINHRSTINQTPRNQSSSRRLPVRFSCFHVLKCLF